MPSAKPLTPLQEETKDELRKKKNKKGRRSIASEADVEKEPAADKPKKKRVSFG